MTADKFQERDAAASRKIWWDLYAAFESDPSRYRRVLLRNGMRTLLAKNLTGPDAIKDREEVINVLLHIKLRYEWAKKSFDGGEAYKQTDAVIKKLERIRLLSEQLSAETAEFEALHFIGEAALDGPRLERMSDSQGVKHHDVTSFFGGLVCRVCIDCAVIAEGLSGVQQRNRRDSGRPPMIANSYLILTGMDLYENMFKRGAVITTGPKDPRGPKDYAGEFYDFISCYTDVMAPEAFKLSKGSTGFGSMVAKIATQYRRDRDLPKRLIPTSDTSSLLLSINTLASISSGITR